ncbi:MAG: glutamate racemase [Magnetococcales bacterium]|nr:glutamate racemase [Magnetococcales bacterium]MBF0439834.1 glutamate racemase [Magnetococcales bacterium]
MYDARPIGIFDSGVGGLTVLDALVRRFPNESFIYLGDTARVPYGTKSARTVERYVIQVADCLLHRGVKGLVVACNTASALGLSALHAHCQTPVLGVIEPGCRAAATLITKRADSGRVGVIGTRSTVASGAYPYHLALLNPRIHVVSLACPLFVPLAEEGWVDHPAVRMIVEETLAPLMDQRLDALILGCTHYPVLKSVIAEVMGPEIALVDSSSAMAEELGRYLGGVIVPAPPDQEQQLEFLVTDVADRFKEMAARFIEGVAGEWVKMVDL